MNWVDILTALGIGGVLTAVVEWLRTRRQVEANTEKTDVDTKLAYLGTVIEKLDAEIERVTRDRDRICEELTVEQDRSRALRKRVRELEDEIDGVRRSARETQHKCDDLAARLKELVDVAKEDGNVCD